MTVSSTQNTKMSALNIVRQAMRRARVLGAGKEPQGIDIEMGVEFLETNLQAHQAADGMLYHVERASITLTAGTGVYTNATGVPTGLLKVRFPASITLTGNTDDIVEQISHEEWSTISDKDYQSVSNRLLVQHTSSGQSFTLYPYPNSTCLTLSFWYLRSLFDAASGNELDIKAQYQKSAIMELAADFADHYRQPSSFVERLKTEARMLWEKVKSGSGDDNDIQLRVPW